MTKINQLNLVRHNKCKLNFTEEQHAELNELAVAAGDELRAGNEDGEKLNELYAYFIETIEYIQERNWHRMNNETHFIADCYRRIKYAAKSYKPDMKTNFISRVEALLYQGVKHYCGKRGDKRKVLTSSDFLLEMENDAQSPESNFVGDEKLSKSVAKIHEEDRDMSVEEQALDKVAEQEIREKYINNENDRVIVEIILDSKVALGQREIARRVSEVTGKSFDQARGMVRTYIKKQQKGMAAK
ncbi:hypothetical protein COM97_27255 [Bacillus thuringiensis]|uniref:hypothetical protein n=1 Tax=Bacillus thuringiensis TaxID=1428 RepID=UPI000BEC9A1F|nr:hypothetical protein [Bacillus thuringiensis]PEF03440.1 hypothetical protein COM97_27255 [Bacillus thuringiensis]